VTPWIARLFGTYHFVFEGPTKKASYEGRLERTPVVPIQGITAVLFVAAGVVGLTLFLQDFTVVAFLVTWPITQVWRVVSEMFRGDFRGNGRISAYQVLALLGAAYGVGIVLLLQGQPEPVPNFSIGLHALWHPGVILSLQLVWIVIFLYTGRSKVTASHLAVSVVQDHV
jgi:hypothetical protein